MTWAKMTDKLERCYLESIVRYQDKIMDGGVAS